MLIFHVFQDFLSLTTNIYMQRRQLSPLSLSLSLAHTLTQTEFSLSPLSSPSHLPSMSLSRFVFLMKSPTSRLSLSSHSFSLASKTPQISSSLLTLANMVSYCSFPPHISIFILFSFFSRWKGFSSFYLLLFYFELFSYFWID